MEPSLLDNHGANGAGVQDPDEGLTDVEQNGRQGTERGPRRGVYLKTPLVAALALLALGTCVGLIVWVSAPGHIAGDAKLESNYLIIDQSSTAAGDCDGGPGWHKAMERDRGEKCYCLLAGSCREFFACKNDTALPECQKASCAGQQPLEITNETSSFRNVAYPEDLITIPVKFYRDIYSARDSCSRDKALKLVMVLLEAGRRVFVNASMGGSSRPQAQYQCVHLPRMTSVHWLNVHTFIRAVPPEGLPTHAREAACVTIHEEVREAAVSVLAQITMDLGHPEDSH